MKNIVLSAVAVFAMSSFAVAGGNIAPIEEPVVEEVVVVENLDAGFYLGLGYGLLNAEITDTYKAGDSSTSLQRVDTLVDDDFGEIMIQAGYKFNAYVAVEGRYWAGVNDGSFLNPNDEVRDAEYGMSIDAYKSNNVLQTNITSHDVAELAAEMCGSLFAKTTAAQLPIDGGNDRVI